MQLPAAARHPGIWKRKWTAILAFAVVGSQASLVFGSAPSPQLALSDHKVRIIRDAYGMAHLYADREEDGFFGLGYAEGEDRLQQILTWYVAVRGELAATFGPKVPPLHTPVYLLPGYDYGFLQDTVAVDTSVRKYRILDSARRNFSSLPAQYQRDLRAFIAGLNAYMRAHPDKTPAWSPPLEPALPIAILPLFALEAQSVCDERRAADAGKLEPYAMRPGTPLRLASNAWAVAGSRSEDGGVFLGSESQDPIQVYGILFYPYHIKAGDLDVMSFELTGSALFLFGHSQYYAWAITDGPRYVADCYRVTVDHNAPRRFLFDGKPQRMTVVPYSVAVKGAAPVLGELEYTHHNGVTSPVEAREGDSAYVVSYSEADRVGLASGEYYRLAKARNRSELQAVLAQRDAYAGNFVIGGADGTIMYLRPGRIPIRPLGVDARYTLSGNTTATAWRGIHSFADMLKLVNPPQGYISNSNVSPDMMYPSPVLKPGDYPDYFGFEPGQTGERQLRLIELLSSTAPISTTRAFAIAMDETITHLRPWGPAIAKAMLEQPDLLREQPKELEPFLESLASFDGTLSKDSRGAMAHLALKWALIDKHGDSTDALAEAIENGSELSSEFQRLLILAAEEGRQLLITSYGRTDLTWGDVHRVGRGDVDYPMGGGHMPMRITQKGRPGHSHQCPLCVPPYVSECSVRGCASFAMDPKTKLMHLVGGVRIPFVVHFTRSGVQSYAQTLWGVSEDEASPHFADQARLASNKELRPIPLTQAALEREQTQVTTLTVPSIGR